MYYEEDLIDWGDGWEDNEDGERIPVLALDGTKPACLRKKCEEEALHTHTESNISHAESSCDTSECVIEDEKEEKSDFSSFDAVVAEEAEENIKHAPPKRKLSWSDPMEPDLITRMTSGPPFRPRAENGGTHHERSNSPTLHTSRLDAPLQQGNFRNYGHYNPRFAAGGVHHHATQNSFQNMPNEFPQPRFQNYGRMNGSYRMQVQHQTSQSWQPALGAAASNHPFQATRWQHAQPMQSPMQLAFDPDRWHVSERSTRPHRNVESENYHNRHYQYSRRTWH